MPDRPAVGLALAFELTELGARLVAQRHRREHPDASDAEIARVVGLWMADRPGAPDGDCVGRPSTRFTAT